MVININGKLYVDVTDLSDEDKIKIETTNVVSYEDYFKCDCCNNLGFVNDGYVQFEDAILCPDCMRNITIDSPHFKEYLDMIINNPEFADKYLTHSFLESLGFTREPGIYDCSPKETLKYYRKQGFDVIFRVIKHGIFTTSYCIYIREK